MHSCTGFRVADWPQAVQRVGQGLNLPLLHPINTEVAKSWEH